jgi:hypothetical protein
VQQQLIGDPCVERALQVLSSADEYKKILTPPAAKPSVEKKKSKKKKK